MSNRTIEQLLIPTHFPTWRVVDAWGRAYILTGIEVKDSVMWGPVLLASYKVEGDPVWHDGGLFRVDTSQVIEPVSEQLATAAA